MSLAREQLQSWYRQAMLRRIHELCGLRDRLSSGDPTAYDMVRGVGQALRGSGGTFGYPGLSAVAALVETSADTDVARRLEGLVDELRALRAVDHPEGAAGVPEWLAKVAGLTDFGPALGNVEGPKDCWSAVARAAGVDEEELARWVADAFGLRTAGPLTPERWLLDLVPHRLVREHGILPVREDSSTIEVATSDPTALRVERELLELTGRTPVFVVAPPGSLGAAVARALGESQEPARPAGSGLDQPLAPPEPLAPSAPSASSYSAPSAASPPSTSSQSSAASAASPASASAPEARRPPPPPAVPSRMSYDPLAAPRGPGGLPPSVLVVDDDEATRLLVRTLLEKRGYGVGEACDGLDALEVLRAGGPFDLVLVDLDMPRMDGLELIWELRGTPEWRHLPAVVVTGEQDAQLEISMMEEGADDYVRKPLDPRLLLARVRATLRRVERRP